MVWTKGIAGRLRPATELTRAGLLVEATALIQQALRHSPRTVKGNDPGAGQNAGVDDGVIDVVFSRVAEPTQHSKPAQRVPGEDLSQCLGLKSLLRSPRERVPADTTTPEQKIDGQPGQFVKGSYANAAGTRPYKLYIPATHPDRPLPLIVMLHGCTQSPDDFANGTRMNALAEQCYVLYPEQIASANHSRCWNWFKRGDQNRDLGEPAILASMTRDIVGRYRVDPGKVCVAGLSAGGAMAAVMGRAYPELYAAVGVHSGLACGSAHDLPSALAAMRGSPATPGTNAGSKPRAAATPTIVFHGDRDRTVHPRNSDQVVSQQLGSASTANASSERGQVPGGHAFTRTVHSDLSGRVVLEHWLVHNGGHAWFGGSPRGSHVDPNGPDATREMIRFFKRAFEQRP